MKDFDEVFGDFNFDDDNDLDSEEDDFDSAQLDGEGNIIYPSLKLPLKSN